METIKEEIKPDIIKTQHGLFYSQFYVDTEKQKLLTVLWKRVNDSLLTNVFLSGEGTYDTLDDLKQLFTEAGMKDEQTSP